jgi:trehalose 6-phosphate synthase/phosphatase
LQIVSTVGPSNAENGAKKNRFNLRASMLLALNQNSNPAQVTDQYLKTRRRLFVLEYDGVVVPYELHPDITEPAESIKSALKKLAKDPRNTVMLMTGRDMYHLDKYWSDLPLILVAENGAFYRVPGGTWQSLFSATNDWMDRIANAMNSLSFQFTGSFIERKNHSLVWHHRTTVEPIYESELKQILAAVSALNHSELFMVRHSEFALELSTAGINPGTFMARWIGGQVFDFIMAMGTIRIDEDVFPLLTGDAFTVRVGEMTSSRANFHIASQLDVIPFLKNLTGGSEGRGLSWAFGGNGIFRNSQSKPDQE